MFRVGRGNSFFEIVSFSHSLVYVVFASGAHWSISSRAPLDLRDLVKADK